MTYQEFLEILSLQTKQYTKGNNGLICLNFSGIQVDMNTVPLVEGHQKFFSILSQFPGNIEFYINFIHGNDDEKKQVFMNALVQQIASKKSNIQELHIDSKDVLFFYKAFYKTIKGPSPSFYCPSSFRLHTEFEHDNNVELLCSIIENKAISCISLTIKKFSYALFSRLHLLTMMAGVKFGIHSRFRNPSLIITTVSGPDWVRAKLLSDKAPAIISLPQRPFESKLQCLSPDILYYKNKQIQHGHYSVSSRPSNRPIIRGSQLLFMHPLPVQRQEYKKKKIIINVPLLLHPFNTSGVWSSELNWSLAGLLQEMALYFELFFLREDGSLVKMDPISGSPVNDLLLLDDKLPITNASPITFLSPEQMAKKVKNIYPLHEVLILNYSLLHKICWPQKNEKPLNLMLNHFFPSNNIQQYQQVLINAIELEKIIGLAFNDKPTCLHSLLSACTALGVLQVGVSNNAEIKTLLQSHQHFSSLISLGIEFLTPQLFEIHSISGLNKLRLLKLRNAVISFDTWKDLPSLKLKKAIFEKCIFLPVSDQVINELKQRFLPDAICLIGDKEINVSRLTPDDFLKHPCHPKYRKEKKHISMPILKKGIQRSIQAAMVKYHAGQTSIPAPNLYRVQILHELKIDSQGEMQYSPAIAPAKEGQPVSFMDITAVGEQPIYEVERLFYPGEPLIDLGPNSHYLDIQTLPSGQSVHDQLVCAPDTRQVFLRSERPLYLKYRFVLQSFENKEDLFLYPIVPQDIFEIVTQLVISAYNNGKAPSIYWQTTFPSFVKLVHLLQQNVSKIQERWKLIQSYCKASDSKKSGNEYDGFLSDRPIPSSINWHRLLPEKYLQKLRAFPGAQPLIMAALIQRGVCADAAFTASLLCTLVCIPHQIAYNDLHAFIYARLPEGWEEFAIGGPSDYYIKDIVLPPSFIQDKKEDKQAIVELKSEETKEIKKSVIPPKEEPCWWEETKNIDEFIRVLTTHSPHRQPLVVLPDLMTAIGLARLIFQKKESQDQDSDYYYVNDPQQFLDLLTLSRFHSNGSMQVLAGPLKQSINKKRKIVLIVDLYHFTTDDFPIMLGLLDDRKPILQDCPLPGRETCRIITLAPASWLGHRIREDILGRTDFVSPEFFYDKFKKQGQMLQLQGRAVPFCDEKKLPSNTVDLHLDHSLELLESLLLDNLEITEDGRIVSCPALLVREDKAEAKPPICLWDLPSIEVCQNIPVLQKVLIEDALSTRTIYHIISSQKAEDLIPICRTYQELLKKNMQNTFFFLVNEKNHMRLITTMRIAAGKLSTRSPGPILAMLNDDPEREIMIWISSHLDKPKICQFSRQLQKELTPLQLARVTLVELNKDTDQFFKFSRLPARIHLHESPDQLLSNLIKNNRIPHDAKIIPISEENCDFETLFQQLTPSNDQKGGLPVWTVQDKEPFKWLKNKKPVVLVGRLSRDLLLDLEPLLLLDYFWDISGQFLDLGKLYWVVQRTPIMTQHLGTGESIIQEHALSLSLSPPCSLADFSLKFTMIEHYKINKQIWLDTAIKYLNWSGILAVRAQPQTSIWRWVKLLAKEKSLEKSLFLPSEETIQSNKGLLWVPYSTCSSLRWNSLNKTIWYGSTYRVVSSNAPVIWHAKTAVPDQVLFLETLAMNDMTRTAEFIKPIVEQCKLTPTEADQVTAIALAGYNWLIQQPTASRFVLGEQDLEAAMTRFMLYQKLKQAGDTPVIRMIIACYRQFSIYSHSSIPLWQILTSTVGGLEKKNVPCSPCFQSTIDLIAALKEKGYCVSKRMEAILPIIDDFFILRELEIDSPKKVLLLQGSPGLGKTALLEHWMSVRNYSPILRFMGNDQILDSKKKDILLMANQGGLLIIEEMNCLSAHNQVWLSQLFYQHDIHSRFRILGTANDSDQVGRYDLIEDLAVWTQRHELPEYDLEELTRIAQAKRFSQPLLLAAAFVALCQYEQGMATRPPIMTSSRSFFHLLDFASSTESKKQYQWNLPASQLLANTLFPLLIRFASPMLRKNTALIYQQAILPNAQVQSALTSQTISSARLFSTIQPVEETEEEEMPSKKICVR
jgi:hypothetical protein